MNAGSSSDCVLELPPDVVSSDASESREASVELPDPIGAQFACCKNKCVDRFNAAQTAAEQRLKKDLEPLNMEGKNAIWFHQLLNMNKAQPEGQRRKLLVARESNLSTSVQSGHAMLRKENPLLPEMYR